MNNIWFSPVFGQNEALISSSTDNLLVEHFFVVTCLQKYLHMGTGHKKQMKKAENVIITRNGILLFSNAIVMPDKLPQKYLHRT